jgi:hypothetical protein
MHTRSQNGHLAGFFFQKTSTCDAREVNGFELLLVNPLTQFYKYPKEPACCPRPPAWSSSTWPARWRRAGELVIVECGLLGTGGGEHDGVLGRHSGWVARRQP